ncbi:MAG: hypothetical protein UZ21_OP11001000774 [Microgenomates bacterium OLB22]|nr:MAG: hypothetical protein UZ21_OP11001000774 [Microgenomates bacterium OLB22]
MANVVTILETTARVGDMVKITYAYKDADGKEKVPDL